MRDNKNKQIEYQSALIQIIHTIRSPLQLSANRRDGSPTFDIKWRVGSATKPITLRQPRERGGRKRIIICFISSSFDILLS